MQSTPAKAVPKHTDVLGGPFSVKLLNFITGHAEGPNNTGYIRGYFRVLGYLIWYSINYRKSSDKIYYTYIQNCKL